MCFVKHRVSQCLINRYILLSKQSAQNHISVNPIDINYIFVQSCMVIVRETENELNNGCNKFKDYFTHTFFHVNILKTFPA